MSTWVGMDGNTYTHAPDGGIVKVGGSAPYTPTPVSPTPSAPTSQPATALSPFEQHLAANPSQGAQPTSAFSDVTNAVLQPGAILQNPVAQAAGTAPVQFTGSYTDGKPVTQAAPTGAVAGQVLDQYTQQVTQQQEAIDTLQKQQQDLLQELQKTPIPELPTEYSKLAKDSGLDLVNWALEQRSNILSIYQKYGINPSPDEVNWQLANNPNLSSIEQSIREAVESGKDTRGTTLGVNARQDIIQAFMTDLGRAPSEDEIKWWMKQGTPVAQGVKQSEEYARIVERNLNEDVNIIERLVDKAKGEADELLKDDFKDLEDLKRDKTAMELYEQFYDTPEIAELKGKVTDLVAQLDEFDQQLEDLKRDIRKEVEGEASESYISALASVRGQDILRAKRSVQRDYDTALARLKNAEDKAQTMMSLTMQDQNTRYNRLMDSIQLQLQVQGQQFNESMAMAQISLQIPQGRSITLPSGATIKGMRENDNMNVVQFTDANRNVYVIGIDKNTGQEVYRTFMGQSPYSGGGGGTSTPTAVKQLAETQAQMQLDFLGKINSGEYAYGKDDEGAFYYDSAAYEAELSKATGKDGISWYSVFTKAPSKRQFWVADA